MSSRRDLHLHQRGMQLYVMHECYAKLTNNSIAESEQNIKTVEIKEIKKKPTVLLCSIIVEVKKINSSFTFQTFLVFVETFEFYVFPNKLKMRKQGSFLNVCLFTSIASEVRSALSFFLQVPNSLFIRL
jgi:hypothetical protein